MSGLKNITSLLFRRSSTHKKYYQKSVVSLNKQKYFSFPSFFLLTKSFIYLYSIQKTNLALRGIEPSVSRLKTLRPNH
jgi:hypothetical protein